VLQHLDDLAESFIMSAFHNGWCARTRTHADRTQTQREPGAGARTGAARCSIAHRLRTMKANYRNDEGDIRVIRPLVCAGSAGPPRHGVCR
jgi:hypothetical protein